MPNEVKTYLEEHSLDSNFISDEFGVTWDENKITIPVYDASEKFLFNRYRHLNGSAKFLSDVGAHPMLFAMNKIKDKQIVVLCEGEPDCMRLWQEDIPAVTGTSGVATFSEKLAEPLKGKNIYLVLDTDDAGVESVYKYIEILNAIDIDPLIIDLPLGYKDICEYFTDNHSKEDFIKLKEKALSPDDWKDKHSPEEFKFEEGVELLTKDLPQEEWLVERILPGEGFCFFFGAEGTAKSFYALTLANSVATGASWLDAKNIDGKSIFTVKLPQKVLIIDKENTKLQTQLRMRGLNMTGENIYWLKYPEFFELSDGNEEDGYSKIAKSASSRVKRLGIKLVIIDSFTDVMIGNENASNDVQKFFDGMRQLFPACSILVLHHVSKPAPGIFRTSAQKARGSTNIMAQIFTGFYVEALPKSKTEFVLEQTKARNAEKLNRFLVELKVEPDPINGGKTIVSAIEYKGDVPDMEMKVTGAMEIIEESFKTNSRLSRQEILDICQSESISSATVDRAIKQMKNDRLIDSIIDPINKTKRSYVWIGSLKGEIYEE